MLGHSKHGKELLEIRKEYVFDTPRLWLEVIAFDSSKTDI